VVGDSQLILGQLRRYKAARNKRLREFYAEARRLGDQLGVRQWIHYLRAYPHDLSASIRATERRWEEGSEILLHLPC
jgi:hypothetical protein